MHTTAPGTAREPAGLTRRHILSAGAGMVLASGPLQAQTAAGYPARPVKIIVSFPPGGSSDLVVRTLAPRLGERLGQQFVIENRGGAGGNIGLDVVAKAAPDGYTLGVGAAGGLAVNVSLYPKMPFDPVKDFVPVAMLAHIPFVLVGAPGNTATTLAALTAHARARPGSLSVAHGGNGTAMHLSAQLWQQMAGLELVNVPYKGSGPAAADAMAGQVPLAMVDLPSALQQIRAGKLIAYAVTSDRRLAALTDVPTFTESGVSGYESTGWFGVVAPAGTPAAIVARLNAEINAVLANAELRASNRTVGVELAQSTPEGFGETIKSETVKWARVIKSAGVKLD